MVMGTGEWIGDLLHTIMVAAAAGQSKPGWSTCKT
jgi:hypothetical protein